MKFYIQDYRNNCGQIAVASVTERSVEEIEDLVGHDHSSTSKELVTVLRSLGYKCDNQLRSHLQFITIPEYCLACLRDDSLSSWHWVAIGQNIVYDGRLSKSYPVQKYLEMMNPCRFTSFLEIYLTTPESPDTIKS